MQLGTFFLEALEKDFKKNPSQNAYERIHDIRNKRVAFYGEIIKRRD